MSHAEKPAAGAGGAEKGWLPEPVELLSPFKLFGKAAKAIYDISGIGKFMGEMANFLIPNVGGGGGGGGHGAKPAHAGH